MSSPTEPSTAAQLIDALMAGGEAVDEGSFSLDTAAAAAKLDAYQYADRSGYLIPIAEAAGGLAARRVRVRTHGEDLSLALEGVTLPDPVKFLAAPFAQARGADRTTRALGRLGVGLHMALGHSSIERIAMSYSTATDMFVAEWRRDGQGSLARRDPAVADELRIVIDRPWTDRIALRGAARKELDHLRAAVRHSPALFEIDDREVSRDLREWDYPSNASGPGYRSESGLERHGEHPSVIELWSQDVCVETLPGPGIGFRAAIHLDAPTRDLSQMTIVHDDPVTAALAAVELEHRKTLEVLAMDEASWSESTRPSHWPKQRVDRVLGRPVRGPELGQVVKRGGQLIFALPFYLAGTGAGIVGFWLLIHRNPWGLFVLIFLCSHAGIGAGQIAKAITRNPQTKIVVHVVLFVIACAVALGVALWGRDLL